MHIISCLTPLLFQSHQAWLPFSTTSPPRSSSIPTPTVAASNHLDYQVMANIGSDDVHDDTSQLIQRGRSESIPLTSLENRSFWGNPSASEYQLLNDTVEGNLVTDTATTSNGIQEGYFKSETQSFAIA